MNQIEKMRNSFDQMTEVSRRAAYFCDQIDNESLRETLIKTTDKIQVAIMEVSALLDLPCPGAGEVEEVLRLKQLIEDNCLYSLEILKLAK